MKFSWMGAAFLVVFACGAGCEKKAVTPKTAQMLVSTSWLAENLKDPGLVILHVAKTRDVYDGGHIPGAQYVDWKSIVVDRDGVPAELPSPEELTLMARKHGLDEKKRIVIYDEALGRFAARAYLTLDFIGLGERASLLDGQLKTWKAEHRPLSREAPRVQPSTYTPRARPGVTVKMDAVKDLISGKGSGKESGVKIVDSRSEKQFCGLEGGDGVARPGHIPGALNIPWKEHLKSEENPVLKSPEELRALYEKAGVKPGDRVVTYCRTGRAASQTYFILKSLGHDVSLYDGSFSEWSARKENPVARSEEKGAVKESGKESKKE